VYRLIIHSTWPWDASRARASCGWATFKADTEAVTATRPRHTAVRTARRRRGSWSNSPAVMGSGNPDAVEEDHTAGAVSRESRGPGDPASGSVRSSRSPSAL